MAQLTGGNGGGRPDFAMAGAKDQTKLDEALPRVPELVKKQLGVSSLPRIWKGVKKCLTVSFAKSPREKSVE